MNVQKQREEEELSDTQKANTRKTSISGGKAPSLVVVAKKKIMTFWYLLYIQMNFIAERKKPHGSSNYKNPNLKRELEETKQDSEMK